IVKRFPLCYTFQCLLICFRTQAISQPSEPLTRGACWAAPRRLGAQTASARSIYDDNARSASARPAAAGTLSSRPAADHGGDCPFALCAAADQQRRRQSELPGGRLYFHRPALFGQQIPLESAP